MSNNTVQVVGSVEPKLMIDSDLAIRQRLKALVDHTPLEQLADFIRTEVNNQMKLTEFSYKFTAFKEDAAYALQRAVNDIVGYSSQGAKGPSPKPAKTIDVVFPDGHRIKVPWGQINLPNMGEDAELHMGYDSKRRLFTATGQCEKRYVHIMDQILNRTEQIVRTDSIYKGQAFKLGTDLKPQFLKLQYYEDTPMYLTAAAEFALEPIVARLEKPRVCKENGLELKFGSLMEGPYGTGKTLLAFKLGLKAINNGWTFIYLTDPNKTEELLKIGAEMSENGEGVLIFVEDINLILNGERDTTMNKVLNLLDGGDTKDRNIISVFTTNHMDLINPTFLRGKRIGSIISLTHLDKETALKFIHGSIGDVAKKGEKFDKAAEMVENLKIVPAFLAEILERVKASMVYNDGKECTCAQVIASIKSYEAQMKLAQIKSNKHSDADRYFLSTQKMVKKAIIDLAKGNEDNGSYADEDGVRIDAEAALV